MSRGKKAYKKYLKSDLWKEIRLRVMERDHWSCRRCGRPAQAIHHLDYRPATMEGKDLVSLQAICRRCHRFEHQGKLQKRRKKKKQRPSVKSAKLLLPLGITPSERRGMAEMLRSTLPAG